MKKLAIFLCFVVPVMGMTFPKEIPQGYIYFGVKLDQNKIKDSMKKVMTPAIYQQMLSQVSMMSKMQIGFDLFNDNPAKMGIDPNGYVEIFFKPVGDKGVIVVPSRKPGLFISSLQKVLKGVWTSVKVEKLGQIRKLYTTNPRFRNDPVFYLIKGSKIYIAPDRAALTLPAGEALDSQLVADLNEQIKEDSPIMVMAGDARSLPDMQMMGDKSFVILMNTLQNKISFDVYVKTPGAEKASINTPAFLQSNPLLMLTADFDVQKIQELLQIGGPNPMSMMMGSMNLAQIIGKTAFLSLQSFNAMELMQRSTANLNMVVGVEIKDGSPLKALLDNFILQKKSQPKAQGGMSFMSPELSKSSVEGYDFYTVSNIPMGGRSAYSASAQGGSDGMSLYLAFVDTYALLGTNEAGLKKVLVNYKSGKSDFKLPIQGENIFLFANVERVVKQINMVFPMLRSFSAQAGIALDNFKYLVGEVPEKQTAGFYRATLSLIFNQ